MNRKQAAATAAVALAAWASLATAAAPARPNAPPSPPAAPAATGPADNPQLNSLIRQLGDADFATREKAQKQLDLLPITQYDALAKVADTTTDEEIKSRLLEQLGRMDERVATELPPISLDLNAASYTQVAAALSKIVGTPMTNIVVGRDGRFTLKATNLPFWEVMRQLSLQDPICLKGDPPTISMEMLPHQQVLRSVMISADYPTVTAAGKVAVTLNIALDPRMRVLDLHPLQVDDARDDQGHLLHVELQAAPDLGAAFGGAVGRLRLAANANPSRGFQFRICTFTTTDPTVQMGKTMTVKGAVKFLVTVAQTTTQIANAGKHLNEPITIGDSKVTIREMLHSPPDAAGNSRTALSLAIVPNVAGATAPPTANIELTPNGFSVKGSLSSANGRLVIDTEGATGGISLGAPSDIGEITTVVVTDATGKTIANYKLPAGQPVTSVHALTEAFQEPLTFTISAPKRSRKVVVPFEFKDLPVQR